MAFNLDPEGMPLKWCGYASGPATDGSTYAAYNATSAAGGYATDVAGSSPGTGYAKGMDQYMTHLA